MRIVVIDFLIWGKWDVNRFAVIKKNMCVFACTASNVGCVVCGVKIMRTE